MLSYNLFIKMAFLWAIVAVTVFFGLLEFTDPVARLCAFLMLFSALVGMLGIVIADKMLGVK